MQQTITILIVAACVVIAAYRIYKRFFRKDKCNNHCEGCAISDACNKNKCGCSKD